MSKNTKKTMFMHQPYECTAVEEYLERMAEKGWLLESIKGCHFKFKKIDTKKVKYSVEVLEKISEYDHKDSDVALEYREYCITAGWTYVCETGKVQIFYTENSNETISIHTDESEKFKSVYKTSVPNIRLQLLLASVWILNICIFLLTGQTSFSLTSNFMIISYVIMVSLIFIIGVRVVNFTRWVIKAKKKLKENKFMPYNNYKQLRRKNIVTKSYLIILLLILFKFFIYDNNVSRMDIIYILIAIVSPLIIMFCVQQFLNKKRYSKDTNMGIMISVSIISIVLIMFITGTFYFRQEKDSMEVASLTLTDFGYEENNENIYYSRSEESVLAERKVYYSDVDAGLDYNVFQSKYHWVISFHKNRLLSGLKLAGIDIKQMESNLPSNIKVYYDSEKEKFVLASQDKVVDIRKEFNYISEEEFLSKVHQKFFSDKQ